MADPGLVKILQQGSDAWNRWREQQPATLRIDLSSARLCDAHLNRVDLSGADLSHADLRDADLSEAKLIDANLSGARLNYVYLLGAKLSGANLSGARLSEAKLINANLNMTDLSGADLSRAYLNSARLSGARLNYVNLSSADLSSANLSGANLSKTNLSGTNLCYANLRHAILEKADWTNAVIGWTIFGDIDLRTVIGLETAKHDGPSTIGLDTIYLSYGQIPEIFLRGAGVPETFITNMRALVDSMSPIEFYSCFISYSHQDEDFAKRLYADLQTQGVRCWFADENLKIGDHYHQRIDEAIRLHDKLILVLSDAAVQSAWVEREVVAALEKEDRQQREVLFPLRLDEAVMETEKAWAADVRRRWHIGDFTHWKDHDSYWQVFNRLLRDLKAGTRRESNG